MPSVSVAQLHARVLPFFVSTDMLTCYPFKGKPGNLIPRSYETTAKHCVIQDSLQKNFPITKGFPIDSCQAYRKIQFFFFLRQDRCIDNNTKMSWKTHMVDHGSQGVWTHLFRTVFYGVPTASLRVPYGFLKHDVFKLFQNLRIPYGFPTGSIRISTGSLRVPYGFPTDKIRWL